MRSCFTPTTSQSNPTPGDDGPRPSLGHVNRSTNQMDGPFKRSRGHKNKRRGPGEGDAGRTLAQGTRIRSEIELNVNSGRAAGNSFPGSITRALKRRQWQEMASKALAFFHKSALIFTLFIQILINIAIKITTLST